MKQLTFLSLLLLVGQAFAGQGSGNGGDAVVCKNGIFMLDYVEKFSNDKNFEKKGDIRELVSDFLREVKAKDIVLYKNVKLTANDILDSLENLNTKKSSVKFTSHKLLNLEDEGFYSLPKNCKIEQLIAKLEPNSLAPHEFVIQEELWSKMNNFQKSVAIMHEALYKYYQEFQENNQNSEVARLINGLVIGEEFKLITDKDYINYLKKHSILRYGFNRDLIVKNGSEENTISLFPPSYWGQHHTKLVLSRKNNFHFDLEGNVLVIPFGKIHQENTHSKFNIFNIELNEHKNVKSFNISLQDFRDFILSEFKSDRFFDDEVFYLDQGKVNPVNKLRSRYANGYKCEHKIGIDLMFQESFNLLKGKDIFCVNFYYYTQDSSVRVQILSTGELEFHFSSTSQAYLFKKYKRGFLKRDYYGLTKQPFVLIKHKDGTFSIRKEPKL